jgi:hypothetical protein
LLPVRQIALLDVHWFPRIKRHELHVHKLAAGLRRCQPKSGGDSWKSIATNTKLRVSEKLGYLSS